MPTVAQADTTYSYIEKKVRRLTASASESALASTDIQQAVNLFYNNDFPYSIKIDQQRSVYKFLTIPNVDRYPVDVNNLQGFRAPVKFQGILGNFFKDRQQLYNLYPQYPTQFQVGVPTVSGTITGIAQPTNPTQITSPNHGLATGAVITISNVGGMVQLNGNNYTITVVNSNTFTLNGIDNTAFGAYTSGGTWISSSNTVSFTLFGNNVNPFPQPNFGILSTQVVIGGIDVNGNPIRIIDDGGAVVNANGIGSNTTTGQLLFIQQNNVGDNVYLDSSNNQQPAIPPYSPLGGSTYYDASYPQYPPSVLTPQYCGTVNYVTTQISINFPVPPAPGTMINIWAATYQVGRPYNILFWNNELTIRPVPDNVYLCEIETFQTPVQFMNTTDNPTLNQWAQYIAYGAACEILRDRQDMEGVANLQEGFKRQEALVLERQAIEEIGQPNITLFNTTQTGYGYGTGWGIGQGF
jgi:ubiquitin-activating enzyme E1-like protein